MKENKYLKTLDELGFKNKTKQKIFTWLVNWINFIDSQNEISNTMRPRRIDFKNWKFFYFTNCSDIIEKDPMFKKKITETNMNKRKANIFLQLFLKYLIDDTDINPKLHCNHCGGDNCVMEGLQDEEHGKMGHIDMCPECGRTQVVTYPGNYDHVMKQVKNIAKEHKLLETTNEYNDGEI